MNAIEPISDRFDPQGTADSRELAAALAGGLSGTSEICMRYEQALAAWFGAKHAVTLSSGSSAVMTALAAFDLQPGDEVMLTPTAPLCTVYPLLALRLVPVFCDTEPSSFSIDLQAAERAITDRTRAIIDIPMWGYPVPADAVASFASRHGIRFLLDLAHGHGVELHGRPLSSFGEIGTFSTHASKILSTGEGGFLLTEDPALAEAACLYSRFGYLNGSDFGMNHKLGGLQAALGVSRLQRLHADIATRRRNVAHLSRALENVHLAPFPVCEGGESNGFTFIVSSRNGDGQGLVEHMEGHGVPSDIRKYRCRALYESPLLAPYARSCPNAEHTLGSITTIPVHPDIGDTDTARIVEALNSYRPRPSSSSCFHDK